MGSLIPFPQDLNLPPPNPLSIPPNPLSIPPNPLSISPKIEPKLEPFDDQHPNESQQPYYYYFSSNPNSIPNPNSNSNNDGSLQEVYPVPEIDSEEKDVYSEFYRISELFRSAFSNKSKYGGMEVLNTPEALSMVHPPASDNRVSTVVWKKALKVRSAEMVRVTGLGIEDERCFRDLVRKTRMLYESVRIFEENVGRGLENVRRLRGDLKAGSLLKDRGLWLNREKRIVGSIPGVYVGDVFFFRMELCVIGLHGHAQAGIDYVPISRSSNGEPVATSIIVSGGYEDDEDGGDVIIYTGHGGQQRNTAKQCIHQKLEGGNLALERSMYYGIEIRVIRGIKHDVGPSTKVYVYDGLYKVVDCWFDIGKSGFGVYKYKLVRMADQPQMGSFLIKFSAEVRNSPLSARPSGVTSLDISNGKEKMPISLFNDIDSDSEPLLFEYLVKPVYPPFAFPQINNGTGCNCVSSCSEDCFCAQRNGGEFPYDRNGILLKGKPLIFECGRFCQCPPYCRNRVSQNGVKHRLEVFRSQETGWGVRPLELIPAGSFICEYTGVVLTREQAALFTMNGDSLVYPSRFAEKWKDWGDLSQVFPEYVGPMHPSIPPLDFAMDVSRMRNVACYFSHSTTPNVFVQFILYDHFNVLYPHLMLFAMENIPPLRELSLDYGVADEWTGKLALCN